MFPSVVLFQIRNGFLHNPFLSKEEKFTKLSQNFLKFSGQKTEISSNNTGVPATVLPSLVLFRIRYGFFAYVPFLSKEEKLTKISPKFPKNSSIKKRKFLQKKKRKISSNHRGIPAACCLYFFHFLTTLFLRAYFEIWESD